MAWLIANEKYRKIITVNSSQVSNSITGFTLRVRFDNDGEIALNVNDDCTNVIFTDINGTQLPHDVVKFDKLSGTVMFDVLTDISSTEDTEIHMYFGSDNTYTTTSPNDAYDLVQHFTEKFGDVPTTAGETVTPTVSPNGSAKLRTDFNFYDPLNIDVSPLGYGLNFNGGDNAYDYGNFHFSAPVFLVEAWIKKDDTSYGSITGQCYSDNNVWQMDFNLSIRRQYITARLRTNTSVAVNKYGNTLVTTGTWHHIAYVWRADTTVLEIYLDGVLDGTHIISGDNAHSYFGDACPALNTIIGGISEIDNSIHKEFIGDIADVRIGTGDNLTGANLIEGYQNITNTSYLTLAETEMNPTLQDVYNTELVWRTEYLEYESRLKVTLKGDEFLGTSTLTRFPFYLNIYNPCLNKANPYGNEIVITDELGEKLPFERHLWRQNINQQRYAGAYDIVLNGDASLTEDTNADGNYRASYLSGVGNSILFNNVVIFNEGTFNLNIRYSNGDTRTFATDVIVNGTDVYSVDLTPTSSWSLYDTTTIPIDVTAGLNSIEIALNTEETGDIDWIQVEGQESAQLKGFVLLPDVTPGVDKVLYIYYQEPNAPIRVNPTSDSLTIQAEDMTIIEGYVTGDTSAVFTSGDGLSLYGGNYTTNGEAQAVFTGASGWYDIISEFDSESDGDNTYELYRNTTELIDSWTAYQTTSASPIQMEKRLVTKVWLDNGDLITIKSAGNGTNTWGRFGQIDFNATVMDPNPNFNSEDVWGDYEAVWHLNETPGHGAPFKDSSGKNRHIFSYNMESGVNNVDSSIGAGVRFFDSKDVLFGTFDPMYLDQNDFTVSMWYQRDDAIANAKEGLFISDDMYARFDNNDKLKWVMSDKTKSNDTEFLEDDYFGKLSFVYDRNTANKTLRRNGIYKTNEINANIASGDNNSIAFGRRVSEDSLNDAIAEQFYGDMAEIRIKKTAQTADEDLNDYKNIIYPQVYVDYTQIVCEENFREYLFEEETSCSIYTDGVGTPLYTIERDNAVTAEIGSSDSYGQLELEMESVGGIIISGSDIQTEFVIERDNPVLISSQTETTAGISYTVEFVRMFTGGILSGGDSSESDEVSYILNGSGSTSFGRIDTSHVIDNGFTLDVYFEDAIGGRILGGGAIVNTIAIYIDNIAGGVTYVKDANETVNTNYINIECLMEAETSGDVDTNNHEVIYLDPSDSAESAFTGEFTPTNYNIYNSSDYLATAETSGTVQTDNQMIYIPDLEVSGIAVTDGNVDFLNHIVIYLDPSGSAFGFTSGDTIRENTYIPDDEVGGIALTSGNVDYLGHTTHYYDPSDSAFGTLSFPTEVIHTTEYYPINLQFVNLADDVNADWNLYDATVEGSVSWGKVESSQEITDERTLRIKITDAFKGTMTLGGTSPIEVIYLPLFSGNVDVLKSSVTAENIVDYSAIHSEYLLSLIIEPDTVQIISINDTDHVELTADISNLHEVVYKPNTVVEPTKTAGLALYYFRYYPESIGYLVTDGEAEESAIYVENFNGGIETEIGLENQENIYIPLTSGSFAFAGGSIREVSYNFTEIYSDLSTSGGIIATTDFFFAESSGMFTLTVSEEEIVDYYDSEYGGQLVAKSASPFVFDSWLLQSTEWCVKGRVDTLDDIPLPAELDLWDIYYVADGSNQELYWWQLRPSGNMEAIANPFYNTGVVGVVNSVDDLPTLGNVEGTVWMVGSCEDSTFYYWDGLDWVQDTYYPATLVAILESIIVLKTKGTASREVSYITDIEVSGELLFIDKFEVTADYDLSESLIPSEITFSGGYDIETVFLSRRYEATGGITISNDVIIPPIDRNNESIVYLVIDGAASHKTSYNSDEALIEANITGIGAELIVFKPLVGKAKISPTGAVSSPDKVIFSIDSPTIGYLGGTSEADFVNFNTSDSLLEVTSIVTTPNSSVYNEYVEYNDTVEAVIIGNTFWQLAFEPDVDVYQIQSVDAVSVDDVEYRVIGSSGFNVNETDTTNEAHYLPEPSGKIRWLKTVSAPISVLTDKLLVSFYPSGKIRTYNQYLIVAARYNIIDNSGVAQTTLLSEKSVDFTNPAVEYGSIVLEDEAKAQNVKYVIAPEAVMLQTSGSSDEYLDYMPHHETADLKTTITSDFTILDIFEITEPQIIINDEYQDPDDVEYIISLRYPRMKVSGTAPNTVDYEPSLKDKKILVSGTFPNTVIYKSIIDEPHVTIATGTFGPNELHAIKKIIAAKISLSGTTTEYNIYIDEIDTAEANINILSTRNNIFKPTCLSAAVKLSKPVTEHYWEVVRESEEGIVISGGITYDSSYQVYRTTATTYVVTSGEADYEEYNIYRKYLYLKAIEIELSGEAKVFPTLDYLYEGSGVIELHGNYLDPVEFYQTYTGTINLYGTGISRLRYDNSIESGTVLVDIPATSADYEEYNKYTARIIDIGKIKVLRTYVTEHDWTYAFAGSMSGGIEVSGDADTEYYPIFDVSGLGRVLLRDEDEHTEHIPSYNYISTQDETLELVTSGTEHNYNIAYVEGDYAELTTSGDDIELEDISVHYMPVNGGIIWGKGTIVDPTDLNDFVNDNAGGTITLKLKPNTVPEMYKIFYYTGSYYHLGSIKIWSGADTHPEMIYNSDYASLHTSFGTDIFQIQIVSKFKSTGKPPVKLSGESLVSTHITYDVSGGLTVGGSAQSNVEYSAGTAGELVLINKTITQIVIERETTGLIDVNVNSNREFNVVPVIEGWLRTGGNDTTASADYVDYGEVDSETVMVEVISTTLYRTNVETDLIFHEITNRREFEAALSDDEITYPEEVWSSLQNFNDLMDDTAEE